MVPKLENKLWLIWKDPTTRERFVVGLLSLRNGNYYFNYIENEGDNNLAKALVKGFSLLPAFPEREKEYSSQKLFYTFLNRLPNRKRKDVQELFKEKYLPPDCSDFEFLKETGGRLPTDTLEFVEPLVFSTTEVFKVDFFVAGTRYYDIDKVARVLKRNVKVKLRLEPDNMFDSHAIEVLASDGTKMGYVPVFYSRYLDLNVDKGEYKSKVLSFNKDAPYNERLKIRVSGTSNLSEIIENLD